MQNKKLNKIDDFSFEAFATVTHNHLLYICRLYLNLFFFSHYTQKHAVTTYVAIYDLVNQFK